MPELPDIALYVERLQALAAGRVLNRVRIANPFLLRTVDPPVSAAEGRRVTEFRRLRKRVVFALDPDLFLVLHLMIAGRLHWKPAGAKIPGKIGLASFDFDDGSLILTEAGSKRRASLHVVRGEEGLRALDPGGLEVMTATAAEFRERLLAENRTLKRALTDPHAFSGIGNAYSDEILFRARLSPIQLTKKLSEEETARLLDAACQTLSEWTDRLRRETGDGFPENVTAFRPDFAVHGRFRKPCPVCSAPIQRIVRGDHETNYCPRCQCGGKILADRSLSRLLKGDWPRTLEELEA